MNKFKVCSAKYRPAFWAVVSIAVINLMMVVLTGCGSKDVPPPIQGKNASDSAAYKEMQKQAALNKMNRPGARPSGAPTGQDTRVFASPSGAPR